MGRNRKGIARAVCVSIRVRVGVPGHHHGAVECIQYQRTVENEKNLSGSPAAESWNFAR